MENNIRKILLLVVLFLQPFLLHAQVYKFKCFQDKYIFVKGFQNEQMDWQDVHILVVIDPNTDKIRIFADAEQNFDIIQSLSAKTYQNGNKEASYSCVDQDGIKCKATLTVFPEDDDSRHVATLTVEYANVAYFFRLKRDD